MTTSLLKTLNEPDPAVRDAAADALGTLQKLLGEKAVGSFLVDVDALKLAKIKEFSDKAVITVKIPKVKNARPVTAPPTKSAAPENGSREARPVAKRPASGNPGKKPVVRKAAASGINAPATKSSSNSNTLQSERELTPEELESIAIDILPKNILSELEDGNWKTRLSAVEELLNTVIPNLEVKTGHSQVLLRVLCKKPGLKVCQLFF